jgi:flavin reductase (DIM6/NTAB) family NADH-FMN oxidoreductase RutF
MRIDPSEQSTRENYQLMIASVVPRPIGWVSTVATDGTANLAPFSYFGAVTAAPPTLILSIGRRRGVRKDTAENLLASGEGVVHVPHRPLAEAMVKTSVEASPDVDEFDFATLARTASERVRPPRVADAAIAFECRVSQHLEVGEGPNDVFLLEILLAHVADDVTDGRLPDPAKLAAVGRLGGNAYCDTGNPFFIARPRSPH